MTKLVFLVMAGNGVRAAVVAGVVGGGGRWWWPEVVAVGGD